MATINIAAPPGASGPVGPPGADVVIGSLPDFFRNSPTQGNGVPNGTSDTIEQIVHLGHAGFGEGSGPSNLNGGGAILDVRASLESSAGIRSGTDRRNANGTFYSTGALPNVSQPRTTQTEPADVVAGFLHTNQSQGVGFGYDGIFATGSAVNQNLGFMAKGNGQFSFQHPTPGVAGWARTGWTRGDTPNAGLGWLDDFYVNARVEAQRLIRKDAAGAGNGISLAWNLRTSNGGFVTAWSVAPSTAVVNDHGMKIGVDVVNDRKLILWGDEGGNPAGTFGLGIRSGTLHYGVPGVSNNHTFISGTGATERENIRFHDGYAHLGADGTTGETVNRLGWGQGMLLFGITAGQANRRSYIGSTVDGALHLGCNALDMISIFNNGWVRLKYVPTYNNVGAATGAGLTAGMIYRTGNDLKIV